MKFNKPPLSIDDQIAKLRSRGMLVEDDSAAAHWLTRIGYYRLSGYCLPFQQSHIPDKPFLTGTRFSDVVALYNFDRELRVLCLDALERIEVTLRTVINNRMCTQHGAHWFMERDVFLPKFKHNEFLDRIDEELEIKGGATAPSRPHAEVFINHYYDKYGDPYLPPGWMICETMSLGVWSRVYANIRSAADRQHVAGFFGFNESIFGSWLHTLNYVRNMSAHHSRLWNRKFVIKSETPRKHALRIPPKSADRFFAAAVVLWDMLPRTDGGTTWNKRLDGLITQHPIAAARIGDMGFPVTWKSDPFWSLAATTVRAAPSTTTTSTTTSG